MANDGQDKGGYGSSVERLVASGMPRSQARQVDAELADLRVAAARRPPPAVCAECGGKDGEHVPVERRNGMTGERTWPNCSKRPGAKGAEKTSRAEGLTEPQARSAEARDGFAGSTPAADSGAAAGRGESPAPTSPEPRWTVGAVRRIFKGGVSVCDAATAHEIVAAMNARDATRQQQTAWVLKLKQDAVVEALRLWAGKLYDRGNPVAAAATSEEADRIEREGKL